jgi:hypothetical protein
MAIGCVRVSTHRGQTMTGKRSTSARIISNDKLPAPTMILPFRSRENPGHGGHGFRTSVIHAVAAAQRLFLRTREGL